MKAIKTGFAVVAFLLASNGTQGQNLGKKLGDAVKKSAENAAVRKTEQKTDQAVSKGIDKATDPNSYKKEEKKKEEPKSKTNNQSSNSDNENTPAANTKQQTGKNNQPQDTKTLEMTYAKSDFVPGDVIIFEDPMDNEKLGEFPSHWDLIKGTSEVVMAAGKKGFEMINYRDILIPLMKNPKNYLGDVFTIEFDFLSVKDKSDNFLWPFIEFWYPNKEAPSSPGDEPLLIHDAYYFKSYRPLMAFGKAGNLKNPRYIYSWDRGDGGAELNNGFGDLTLDFDTWHHVAISFNKRAWKVYVNGVRIINVPNVGTPPGWFRIIIGKHYNGYSENKQGSILFSNFRIAKGAVPLYDRMMNEGKIITYGITFDVGKSTIKPESMGEINRIVTLMKENPDIKFSVEGHTDNTGTSANNLSLSEARSQAVVAKLVEMGISKDRLKAAGKGQNSPIADNATDEGRAKNRRVEFVKF